MSEYRGDFPLKGPGPAKKTVYGPEINSTESGFPAPWLFVVLLILLITFALVMLGLGAYYVCSANSINMKFGS